MRTKIIIDLYIEKKACKPYKPKISCSENVGILENAT